MDEISTADDSGHRECLEKEVEELLQLFLGGQYLKTITRKPLLRVVDGQPKLVRDGLWSIADGKKVIKALTKCLVIWNDPALCDEHEWTDALAAVMKDGVDVGEVEFANDDDHIHAK